MCTYIRYNYSYTTGFLSLIGLAGGGGTNTSHCVEILFKGASAGLEVLDIKPEAL